MSELVLHAVSVGKGILAISPLPGRKGSYQEDLVHLKEWQPSILISMTTMAEMVAEGAQDLGTDMVDSGCRWVHLPIADFGAPTADIAAQWPEVSAAALAALRGGGRVLVHCRGGCGRSGMVALRLMIEAGEAPDVALTRLRKARDCAVETEAQLNWALLATPEGGAGS